MGWRYISFRIGFELKKKLGLLKKKFPIAPLQESFFLLKDWRLNATPFFFHSKENLGMLDFPKDKLGDEYVKLKDHKFSFFSSLEFDLGPVINWMENPDTGFKYNSKTHWLDINDFDAQAGDIKFVWEASRFSHLYTIIRYDKKFGVDCSIQVFESIESWMNSNGINQGPNFKCSQEISLRVLNWSFALYYYRYSDTLTEELFQRIMYFIHWQIEHVYENIKFSRIAVRNNHAITETLLLYLGGLLFPQFPSAEKWKRNGKRWFEEEIAYQIYEDGTFLQFSMNYHRVLVQLLTWALRLSEINGERFVDVVYLRAQKSLTFLIQAMNIETGWLPNYGSNDGALFFKLNDSHYRDYRPQLQALSLALGTGWKYGDFEDAFWYGLNIRKNNTEVRIKSGSSSFEKGGYYIYRKQESLTFIRCGSHKDRPAQADNLHLDIWYKDFNILHDAGSYKYNSTKEDIKYFMGTRSHNTIMLGDFDQMQKGSRFIWYNWTQCKSAQTVENDEYFSFTGIIKAFTHVNKRILHKRTVKVFKYSHRWEILDEISNKPPELPLHQLWHSKHLDKLSLESTTTSGETIEAVIRPGYYSDFYGQKDNSNEICFSTMRSSIKTIISIRR